MLAGARTSQGVRVLLDFMEVVSLTAELTAPTFPLQGEREVGWLCDYTIGHGGTFDGRHTKWCLEQKIGKEKRGGPHA